MTKTFSANGTQLFGVPQGCDFTIAASGTFGSGTLSVKYRSEGLGKAYAGGDTGDFTAADERIFRNCGDEDTVELVLAGATAPSLKVVCTSSK